MSDAFQFILKHFNIGAKVDGLYSKDVYELPIKSIRELVANAVIHRSYLVESKIQISIFDDRIEATVYRLQATSDKSKRQATKTSGNRKK